MSFEKTAGRQQPNCCSVHRCSSIVYPNLTACKIEADYDYQQMAAEYEVYLFLKWID